MQEGDTVLLGAAVLGPLESFVLHETQPMFGTVESLVAGSPPTDVVVVWSDGSRVTYADVNSGATSVLFRLGGVVGGLPLIGFVAQPKAGTGIPNPGTRMQGPIIQHFGLEDPTTAVIGEVIILDTPIGFLVIDPANATILPAE